MSKKKKSRFWAGTLSLIFPGIGQFYNGSWIKGLIILGLIGLSFFMMLKPFLSIIEPFGSLDNMVDAVFSMLTTSTQIKLDIDLSVQDIIMNFSIWSGVFFAIYIYSVIDAISTAAKLQKQQTDQRFEEEVMREFALSQIKKEKEV